MNYSAIVESRNHRVCRHLVTFMLRAKWLLQVIAAELGWRLCSTVHWLASSAPQRGD